MTKPDKVTIGSEAFTITFPEALAVPPPLAEVELPKGYKAVVTEDTERSWEPMDRSRQFGSPPDMREVQLKIYRVAVFNSSDVKTDSNSFSKLTGVREWIINKAKEILAEKRR